MSFRTRLFLVGIWLLFTVSLTAWWLIFGLQQVDHLKDLLLTAGVDVVDEKVFRQHTMLMWEGGILLFSLLVGGISLFYLVFKTQRQSRKLKEFFATFSHDLRTSLASLRLQAESLQEDFPELSSSPLFERMINDANRLQVQLENSLFLAYVRRQNLYLEELELEKIVKRCQEDWPHIEITLSGQAAVQADARALESVLKNLVHNAHTHGEAEKVFLSVEESASGVLLRITDNGKGFAGKVEDLGTLFLRHSQSSGSGVGLYLVRNLVEKMNGKISFCTQKSRALDIEISLPGKLI